VQLIFPRRQWRRKTFQTLTPARRQSVVGWDGQDHPRGGQAVEGRLPPTERLLVVRSVLPLLQDGRHGQELHRVLRPGETRRRIHCSVGQQNHMVSLEILGVRNSNWKGRLTTINLLNSFSELCLLKLCKAFPCSLFVPCLVVVNKS